MNRVNWLRELMRSLANALPDLGFHRMEGRCSWQPRHTLVVVAGRYLFSVGYQEQLAVVSDRFGFGGDGANVVQAEFLAR
jgi:hypothetical protein